MGRVAKRAARTTVENVRETFDHCMMLPLSAEFRIGGFLERGVLKEIPPIGPILYTGDYIVSIGKNGVLI